MKIRTLAKLCGVHRYKSDTPTPDEIFNDANKRIFHQDDALFQLSNILHYHLRNLENYQKYSERKSKYNSFLLYGQTQNIDGDYLQFKPAVPAPLRQPPIFLTGTTGSGKTHIIKQLCTHLDLNFAIVDSTHLAPQSYRGRNICDVGEQLHIDAKGDELKLQFSVVFFDEFDKLFAYRDSSFSEFRRSIATELLTLVEGNALFPCRTESLSFNSENVLFILGGSFNLAKVKDDNSGIGFTTTPPTNAKAKPPSTLMELSNLGLPDELVGRLGKIITMQPLDGAMLSDILLNSPTSPFVLLNNKLRMVQSIATISPDTIQALIDQNQEAIKTFGVRGLYQGFNALPYLATLLNEAVNNCQEEIDSRFELGLDKYQVIYSVDDEEEDEEGAEESLEKPFFNTYISTPNDDIPF